MRIIDSHQHFWKFDPVRDSWIDDTMKVLQRDFLPEQLQPIYRKHGVDGCVAVQADQSEKETEFLLSLSNQFSFIKGVVGWVDLLSENVEERLFYFSKYKKLSGIRHIVQAEANDFMLREDFQNGISKLKQFGLAYDILVTPPQLPSAIELVQNFTDQPFVLDHMAKPSIKEGKIENWKKNIEVLAKFPNVYCKVSGMVTEADWENWSKDDFTKYLDIIFNAFGTKRILYGSDWPVCLLAAKYHQQLNIIEDYIAKFSIEDKEKIMGENAAQFYNLKFE